MTPNIPILSWSPDTDQTVPGVLSDIESMVPTLRGYSSEASLATSNTYTLTLTQAPCGSRTVTYKAGNVPFVATPNKIQAFLGGSWVDVSRAATTYVTAAISSPWRFDAFSTPSNDRIALAVQIQNKLQEKTDTTAGAFADVTAAPSAATMAVQRNFVILGNYVSGGTPYTDGWICSALEDHKDWTPDIATQCATGRLTATPGEIIRLIAFQDYVVAFKTRSMYRGTYVGASSNTWSWPVVSRSVGLFSHDAVVEVDGVLFWLGLDGFYRWAGGSVDRIQSAPFEWLLKQFDTGWFTGIVQAAWDPVQRVIRWTFLSYLPGTTRNLCLTYHPESNRWGKVTFPDCATMMTLPVATVMLTPYAKSLYPDFPVAYLSKSGSNYLLQTASGSSGASSFTTGDIGDDEQVFALTRMRARFTVAPSNSVATQSWRMNLGDALTVGDAAGRTDGKYDFGHAARWHRITFAQTGMYEVTGFSVETPKAGRR